MFLFFWLNNLIFRFHQHFVTSLLFPQFLSENRIQEGWSKIRVSITFYDTVSMFITLMFFNSNVNKFSNLNWSKWSGCAKCQWLLRVEFIINIWLRSGWNWCFRSSIYRILYGHGGSYSKKPQSLPKFTYLLTSISVCVNDNRLLFHIAISYRKNFLYDNCRSYAKGYHADNECKGTDSFSFKESPPGLFSLLIYDFHRLVKLLCKVKLLWICL